MKFLKRFKLFEATLLKGNEFESEEAFLNLLKNRGIRYTKRGNIIDCNQTVDLRNLNLYNIPIKFGLVNGQFSCENNKLNSFEFLPDSCETYDIRSNPGFKGLLENIYNSIWKCNSSRSFVLWNRFIKNCVANEVWKNGKANEYAIKDSFAYCKYDKYLGNKDEFMRNFTPVLSIDDKEIFCDYLKISKSSDWLSLCFKKLINNLKKLNSINSGDMFERGNMEHEAIINFKLLLIVMKSDEPEILELIKEYGLEKIYDRIKSYFTKIYSSGQRQIINDIRLLIHKLNRSQQQIDQDENYDLFYFIGRYKFVDSGDGENYKKKLEIENLCKVDPYDIEGLLTVSGLKLRANAQHDSKVFSILMPKGAFDKEQDNYFENEIPDYMIKLIDSHKKAV